MAKRLIVGKEELKIVKKVVDSPDFKSMLFDQWQDIAIDLEIPADKIKDWKKKGLHDDLSLKEILIKMVDTWAKDNGTNAYLDELQKVFRNNGLTSLSESLENQFKVVQKVSGMSKEERLANLLKILCSEETLARVRNQVKINFDFNAKDKLTFPEDAIVLPKKGRGCALLLNIHEFRGHEKRDGSLEDTDALREFLEQLGFDIFSEPTSHYITKANILELLRKFLEFSKERNARSVFVFIGSHGRHPYQIATSDLEWVDLYKDIVSKFYNNADGAQHLKERPKMFLIQACQVFEKTDALEDSGVTSDVLRTPLDSLDVSNIIICFSTSPGGYSVRNPAGGTFFLWFFMEAMNELVKEGVSYKEILEAVVSKTKELNISFQTPSVADHGLSKLYFDA